MGVWTRLKEWLFGIEFIAVDDVINIMNNLDTNNSGYISINELINGVKNGRR